MKALIKILFKVFVVPISSLILIVAIIISSISFIERSLKQPTCIQVINQWAIVIGVGNYKYLNEDTFYSVNDAKIFSKQLSAIYGSDHVTLLMDSTATKCNFKAAILNWLVPKVKSGDTVLIFYAGHGNSDYLQMYDSFGDSYDGNVRTNELNTWLNMLKSQNIILILDSCGSGGFGDKIVNSSRVILTGSTGTEKCWQEKLFRHGIFSYYLIEALKNLKTIDCNKDNNISSKELFVYVQQKVLLEFEKFPPPSMQHPEINGFNPERLVVINY